MVPSKLVEQPVQFGAIFMCEHGKHMYCMYFENSAHAKHWHVDLYNEQIVVRNSEKIMCEMELKSIVVNKKRAFFQG